MTGVQTCALPIYTRTLDLLVDEAELAIRREGWVPPAPKYQELTGSDEWKTAAPADAVLKGKWWEMFGDPQLNKLEEQVDLNNFNVKQIEAQFRQARALLLANTSALYPSIGTTPSISQTDRGTNAGGRGFGSSGLTVV